MISDVMRKISREHTLVLTERGREDATLPTDLWKRPVRAELNSKLTLFMLDSSISSKLFFLGIQYGSSLIDPVLLQEET